MPESTLPTPNGWFKVLLSSELKRGEIKNIDALGRRFVVFRGDSGKAGALDAHCPHLGAHLGVGGTVVGDTIRCPFHGWQWNGQGQCTAIPYAERIPPGARARNWPVDEINGHIFIWHHANNGEPFYRIPKIDFFGSPEWTSDWVQYSWDLRTHPQEVMENAIDWAHFMIVHKTAPPKHRESHFEDAMFKWVIDAPLDNVVGGPSENLFLIGENWGLGFNSIHYRGAAETFSVATLTPLNDGKMRLTNHVIGKKGSRSEADAMGELRAQMEEQSKIVAQDFAIWENKSYRDKPMLCDGDGPILEYRLWARQFYA
jgi:3-ketosteroid 9alpha-monooxygenase subunit A